MYIQHCNMCDLSETEDEIHFLFICSLYDTFRTTLFQTVTENNHNFLELNNADNFLFFSLYIFGNLCQNLWRLHGKRENRNYSDYELLVLF